MRSDLPAGWTQRTLYELATYQNGRAFKPSETGSEGLPVVKIAELNRGITDATRRYAGELDPKHEINEGDLLFAWSGSVGIYRYAGPRAALNQHIFKVTAESGVDQGFLRWLLLAQMPVFERVVADQATTMGHVKVADLKRLTAPLPPVDEQRRIAWVLGSLDDKIELNRRIAETLEQIAATIFKARFVDFVGVEEFEESELGPIPKGWQAVRFSEAVTINPRVDLAKGTDAPYIEMAAVPAWGTRPVEIARRPYSGGARFERGDTLMARITGCIEHGKGAFVDFLDEPGAGSTEFLVFRATERLTPEAVFLLSRTERVREHAISNMSGSSGRQRVPTSCFDHLWIALPPDRICCADEARAFEALMKQTRSLWSENKILVAIRDALLPKLISGDIRVPENFGPDDAAEVAEELVESEGRKPATETATSAA